MQVISRSVNYIMSEESPRVSICIPTYNRAGMVGMAIESALSQSYSNIEILVIDNASEDNIESVVAAYNDFRLKFFRNERNLGLFGNFNRCVELARGKYIHILHSDDFLAPGFTQACIECMESNPHVAMTFSALEVINQGSKKRIDVLGENKIFIAPEGFRQILMTRNLVHCPTVIVRRDVYDTVGKFACEYPYAADFYQWLKISRAYDIAYISDATLFYRQGEHSESFRQLFKSSLGYIDILAIFIRMSDECGEEYSLYIPEINIALRRYIRDCLFAGITRANYITGYSSSIFFGYALTAWNLIRSESLLGFLKKMVDLGMILGIWGLVVIPGVRYCWSRIILRNKCRY